MVKGCTAVLLSVAGCYSGACCQSAVRTRCRHRQRRQSSTYRCHTDRRRLSSSQTGQCHPRCRAVQRRTTHDVHVSHRTLNSVDACQNSLSFQSADEVEESIIDWHTQHHSPLQFSRSFLSKLVHVVCSFVYSLGQSLSSGGGSTVKIGTGRGVIIWWGKN